MTLRQHLEAILARHLPYNPNFTGPYTRADLDLADAVAALKALDEADRYGGIYNKRAFENHCRLVPDPAPPTENT